MPVKIEWGLLMKMYDVFISYRRSDGSAAAESIAHYLRQMGLRVFFDRNEIKDSQDFKNRIETSLRQAPNYLLIASTTAFQFYTDREDWVRREMEIACENYDGNSGSGRVITVVVPGGAVVPEEKELPEAIRCLANPNQIVLEGQLPADEEKHRILKAVTMISRHNLWNAGCRWLEESKKAGGRFSSLDINTYLFPNASRREQTANRRRIFPIFVQPPLSAHEKSKPLMEALAENTDHVCLIGQGGIGKTTTLVHIMDEAYAQGRAYENARQIPLFVSLSAAPDTYGALYEGGRSTFICRSIYKQVCEGRPAETGSKRNAAGLDEAFTIDRETAVEPVAELLSRQTGDPEYLLLLDGLNEVSRKQIEEVDRSVIQMILGEINWLLAACPNVRLVITGRADESAICGDRLTRLALSGVKKPVIRQYLASCDCPEEKIAQVFQNDALLETLRVPLFLVMYANLRGSDEISTQGEILRIFFSENRDEVRLYTAQGRLAQVEDDVENAANTVQKTRITAQMQYFMLDFLLPEIAWYMEQRDLFALDVESVAQIIGPVLNGSADCDVCGRYGKQLFTKYCASGSAKTHTRKTAGDILTKLGSGLNEVAENVIDCCVFSLGILSRNGGKYGFVHQHIRSYFAVQKLINQMWLAVYLYENGLEDAAYACLCAVLRDDPLPLTLRRFLGEVLGEHRNKPRFIDGKWRYMVPEELCEESLIRYCLHILRGRLCDRDHILHNLILVINEVRTDLSGEDLSNLDFSNCSLNRMRLSRMDLRASLQNTVLNRHSLFSGDHTDLIYGGSFSPVPGLFITASRDGAMKIWDIRTSACVRTIHAHQNGLSEYHHSQCRSLIVTVGRKTIKFWNDETFELIKTIPLPGDEFFRNSEMRPDGKYITYLTRAKGEENANNIWVLDVDTGEHIVKLRFEKGMLQRATLCEDERYLLVEYEPDLSGKAGERGSCFELYDRETDIWTDLDSYSSRGKLAICENIGYLVIQGSDRLMLADPVKKILMEAELGPSRLFRYRISEDGALVTAAHNGGICFRDMASGAVIAKFQTSDFFPYWGILNRKTLQYAVSDGNIVMIYDGKSEKLLSRIDSFWLRVQSATLSGDSGKLLTSSGNEIVQIWDREAGQYRCRAMILCDRGDFMFAQWTKNDTHCLVTYLTKNKKQRIQHYNGATGQLLRSMDLTRVRSYWYCPDCSAVFLERKVKSSSGKETVIEQYDLDTFTVLQTWTFSGDYDVGCVKPDGRAFILFYKHERMEQVQKACVYDAQRRCMAGEMVTDCYVTEFRYSPDRKYIFTAGDGGIYIFDSETYACLRVFKDKSFGWKFAIRFDGSQMAIVSSGVVHIWDVETMELLHSLPHPASWITLVEYSSDGQSLVTATSDGTVFIWDVATWRCIQTIPNVPGLFVQSVDLRHTGPASGITEENRQVLGLYGALVD